jgi:hypothetical protein
METVWRIVKIWTWQKQTLPAHQTTRRHILAERDLHGHLLEKFRSSYVSNNISRLGYSNLQMSVFKSSVWLLRSQVFRSLHLANPISRCGYTDLLIWLLRLWVFTPPHVGTQLSRSGYSRCLCRGTQSPDRGIQISTSSYSDLHSWVLKISRSWYSRSPDVGVQHFQMWLLRSRDHPGLLEHCRWDR